MAELFISLGSNLDRTRHLRSAIAALRGAFGAVTLSPVYESDAVGFAGPPFYNLVARTETDLAPAAVVALLHRIEDANGRDRSRGAFASRTLDLDLLLYDDLVTTTPDYTLPRDEITEHAFVLAPLADLAGALRHPLTGQRYADLWAGFDRGLQPLWKVPFDWQEIA